jgi:glycine cleavage system H lipoate-binding protein
MSESDSRGNYPIVPPNEIRCVWMSAGVVSYQLCDRKLECEQCPLDIALRQRFVNEMGMVPRKRSDAGEPGKHEKHSGMLYGRKHVWLRKIDKQSVRVGLEPGLASVLLSPKTIVLPAIGEQVVHDKVCAWVVMEGGTLPVVSPVSGRVCSTNAELAENPHAVCMSPLTQGWLFDLAVEGNIEESAGLLPVDKAAIAYAEDERRFQGLLTAELSRGGDVVGPTLADGGQSLGSLSEILGPAKYFKLVRSAYT